MTAINIKDIQRLYTLACHWSKWGMPRYRQSGEKSTKQEKLCLTLTQADSSQRTRMVQRFGQQEIFWNGSKKYIDDILSLFRGNLNKTKWFIQTLNSICPGVVEFTFEFSTTFIIFLNKRLISNREIKQSS